jgi:hypothetical protein
MTGKKKSCDHSSDQSNDQDRPDLEHRDWLIRSITKMIQKVDLKIRIKQKKRGQTKILVLENVSESNLNNLYFITNTDQNNNFLYLESVKVFLNDDYEKTPIYIPGLTQIMLDSWNQADNTAFLNSEKIFYPFVNPLNGPSVPGVVTSYVNPISVPNYVDIFTSMSPYIESTYGKTKTFTIILNPDLSSPISQQPVADIYYYNSG